MKFERWLASLLMLHLHLHRLLPGPVLLRTVESCDPKQCHSELFSGLLNSLWLCFLRVGRNKEIWGGKGGIYICIYILCTKNEGWFLFYFILFYFYFLTEESILFSNVHGIFSRIHHTLQQKQLLNWKLFNHIHIYIYRHTRI